MNKGFIQGKKFLGWLVVGLGIFFFFNNMRQFYSLHQVEKALQEARLQNQFLKEEKERLKEKKQYVQTEDFVEKEAREKLGLGFPNQVKLVLPDFKKPEPQIETISLPVWQQWWELLFP